jgi:predicted ATP-dependent Lon-type protease
VRRSPSINGSSFSFGALVSSPRGCRPAPRTLLIPISARRQLNNLSDEMATKIMILFYADAREALIKALAD